MFRVSSLHAAFLACITILVSSALASDTGCRYFPGDACWPNPAEWAAFNKTVNGRLIATIPIASVCHQNSLVPYNAAKCQQLQDNWLLPETHYTTSSSIMAQFFANFSCDPFTPPTAQCVLGTYVQYAVRAATLDDYKKTMAFATARNIRFVIRNTGHDYFGKSTGAGALALWTHHLKDTQFLDYQSRYYTGKAMRIGAGMQVREVIEAAHARGLVVAGAQCQSVGLAGGYLQGGGHSLMASQIGLGADQVLEWEAVTPRGQYLVATPDRNADLYWALAGGGGSTYAAVLSVTLKAFPDVKVAGATFTVTKAGNPGISDSQFSAILKAWLLNLPGIVDSGGAALWSFAEGFLSVTPVFAPNMTVSALRNLLSPTLRVLNGSGIRYCGLTFLQ